MPSGQRAAADYALYGQCLTKSTTDVRRGQAFVARGQMSIWRRNSTVIHTLLVPPTATRAVVLTQRLHGAHATTHCRYFSSSMLAVAGKPETGSGPSDSATDELDAAMVGITARAANGGCDRECGLATRTVSTVLRHKSALPSSTTSCARGRCDQSPACAALIDPRQGRFIGWQTGRQTCSWAAQRDCNAWKLNYELVWETMPRKRFNGSRRS